VVAAQLWHRQARADLDRAIALSAHERDQLEQRWIADPPSSAAAFAESEALVDEWRSRLAQHSLAEVRPAWLQERHTDADIAACMAMTD
jgi:hypothetical protein